jgi:prepilin-type N-terminal cleavage/methylation domain-containing protein
MPRRSGFTLIELLIILVIIAILATIGVSRFWAARDRSLFAALQSDLRNMGAHQELYFGKNLVYASTPASLPDYAITPGVVISVTYAASDGWAANATHASLGGRQCGYFTGNAPAAMGAPATVHGQVACN